MEHNDSVRAVADGCGYVVVLAVPESERDTGKWARQRKKSSNGANAAAEKERYCFVAHAVFAAVLQLAGRGGKLRPCELWLASLLQLRCFAACITSI